MHQLKWESACLLLKGGRPSGADGHLSAQLFILNQSVCSGRVFPSCSQNKLLLWNFVLSSTLNHRMIYTFVRMEKSANTKIRNRRCESFCFIVVFFKCIQNLDEKKLLVKQATVDFINYSTPRAQCLHQYTVTQCIKEVTREFLSWQNNSNFIHVIIS